MFNWQAQRIIYSRAQAEPVGCFRLREAGLVTAVDIEFGVADCEVAEDEVAEDEVAEDEADEDEAAVADVDITDFQASFLAFAAAFCNAVAERSQTAAVASVCGMTAISAQIAADEPGARIIAVRAVDITFSPHSNPRLHSMRARSARMRSLQASRPYNRHSSARNAAF